MPLQEGFDPTSIVQYGYAPVTRTCSTLPASGLPKPYSARPRQLRGQPAPGLERCLEILVRWIWGAQPFIPSAAVENSATLALERLQQRQNCNDDHHSWYINYAGEAGENWDFAVLPADAQGVVNGRIDADTFRVWKGTQHPEEAFQVLTYLLGEGAPELLSVYGAMPARKTLLTEWYADQDEQRPGSRTGTYLLSIWPTRISPAMRAICRTSTKPGTGHHLQDTYPNG